jgi:gliding motility-associated-like protein
MAINGSRIMKKLLLTFSSCAFTMLVYAQTPVITDVDPIRTSPGSRVVITGSGFSATPASLDVWFDNVKGTITSSSEFAIEVTVPFNAKAGNLTVINKVSRLAGKSSLEFAPYFNGESLTLATIADKFVTPGQTVTTNNSNEYFDLCTCDFDGDGKADLVGTRTGTTAADMAVLRNTSTGVGTISFAVSSTPVASAKTFNTICGDLNGDGKPDLVATRAVENRNQIFVKENTSSVGNITFNLLPTLLMDVNHVAFRPIIRDLNGDGRPEIIVSNANDSPGNVVYVFLNQSTSTISINPVPLKLVIPDASSSYGIEVQDLDGDNKPEIIINQFNKPDFFVMKNVSGAQVNIATATKFSLGGVGATLNQMTSADFNNDGKLDLAFTNSTINNKVHVMLNNSTSSAFAFTELGPIDTGDGAFGIDAADLDGDKDIDIVVGNIDFNTTQADTEVTVLINNGNFGSLSFSKENLVVGKKSRNIKIADLDGDAKPEIIFTTVTGNTIDVLRNKTCFVPEILNPRPLDICDGQTIPLESIPNPGATFQWSESVGGDIGGATSGTHPITAPGEYTLTATSEAGTCSTSTSITVGVDTQSITQNPVLTGAAGGVMTVCLGEPLQLGTSSVEPIYEWTGPGGFTSNLQNPAVTASATNDHAGLYELLLRSGDCRSNVATVRVDVVNLEGFVVTSNPTSGTACTGGSITLSTASVAGYSYQWIKDDTGDITGQTSSNLTVTEEGSYSVRVTRTALGCSTESPNFETVFLDVPVASFTSPTTACTATAVDFTSTSTIDPAATPTYSWNFGDASSPATTATASHSYATANSFTVTLTVGYSGVAGCSDNETASINVTVPVPPTITPSATGICPDETITLSIPNTYTSVLWSDGATTTTTSVTTSGTFTVDANDPNGCATDASVVITDKVVPEITVTTDPEPPIAPGLPINLEASGADTYAWSPSETLSDPSIANPVATPLVTTTYTVVGVVAGGCSGEQQVTVEVLGDIEVTNAFSPNGDGINDFWVIPGIEVYSECTLSVFDSQGSRILEKKGYSNDWDGTSNGKIVPEGTYYFVIAGCPDKQPINGHVLVAY